MRALGIRSTARVPCCGEWWRQAISVGSQAAASTSTPDHPGAQRERADQQDLADGCAQVDEDRRRRQQMTALGRRKQIPPGDEEAAAERPQRLKACRREMV